MNSSAAEPDGAGENLPDIAQELRPFLRPDKVEQGMRVVTTHIELQRSHSGPLPAPEDFEHYDSVLPGGANRILVMAEKEQNHRHRQEGRMVSCEFASRIFGQIGAMIALLAMLATVAYCAFVGQPLAAAVLGAISTIVLGFLKYSASAAANSAPAQPARSPAKRKRK